MKKQKPLNEQFGLSVEETLNRLIWLGQTMRVYEEEHGEKLDAKILSAVLNANSLPKEMNNG
jgi:hypothetical protein